MVANDDHWDQNVQLLYGFQKLVKIIYTYTNNWRLASKAAFFIFEELKSLKLKFTNDKKNFIDIYKNRKYRK